ncbi:MAG: SDR family oxidoreductase [Sagittula sp.]|uniref:SDR family oxidoreductase n=1 Tax=Sagittula sp. TaxID=2038081 RepID=UPI0040580B11
MTARGIVITGAGSGIGRATARAFLDEGWRVGLIGRRAEMLEETAAGRAGAECLPCDVTDPAAVDAAFAAFVRWHGRIDALFNNAGTLAAPATIDEIPVEDWLRVAGTNITGMYLCARAAFALMRRQDPRGGRIVNMGSISAHAPRPGSAPYTTSKHAVTGLTRTLALDGRPFGIACGQIDVGNTESALTAPLKDGGGVMQADGSLRNEPVMSAEDVARSVLLMATMPDSTNIQELTILPVGMPFVGRG